MTKETFANWALCLILGALLIFAFTGAGSALTPKGLFVGEPQPSPEAAELLKDVELVESEFILKEHGTVQADFHVKNNTAHTLNKFNITCDFADDHDTYLGRKTWGISQTVPSMYPEALRTSQKMYLNKNYRKADCRITDVQVEKESFFTVERHVAEGHEAPASGGH